MFLKMFFALCFFCVFHLSSQCDLPVFTPSSLVVKYGDPASATCTVCQDCWSLKFNMEISVGGTNKTNNTVLWTVDSLTEWGLKPSCFYVSTDGSRKTCQSTLPTTLYKPPDAVDLSFVNHTGPMVEGGQYTLLCSVTDVAPVGKLSVTFYKGHTVLGQPQISRSSGDKPVNENFTLNISSSKEDDGVQYRCEAKLDLGPAGPQPPPVVMSQSIAATVYYKPEFTAPSHPDPIVITEGNLLQLNCSAVGHPSPSYAWTTPSQILDCVSSSILTINSTTTQDTGKYTCSVKNILGSVAMEFDVEVKANIIVYIILGVLLAAVAVIFVASLLYVHYYKQNKTGKYDMKKPLFFHKKHSTVPTAE